MWLRMHMFIYAKDCVTQESTYALVKEYLTPESTYVYVKECVTQESTLYICLRLDK